MATAQKALGELRREGYIEARPGEGYFVLEKKAHAITRISLFMPHSGLSFFTLILGGIYAEARKHGVDLEINSLNTDKLLWNDSTMEQLEKAADGGNGIIFIEEPFDRVREKCDTVACAVPFVSMEWVLGRGTAVVNDYTRSGELALEYLSERGCGDILVLKGRELQYNASRKLRGIRRGCDDFTAKGGQITFMASDFDAYTGYTVTKDFLETHPDVDGIICANDYEAIGVMGALVEKGRLPGKDTHILGYGNMTDKTTTYIPLATIDQHLERMGRDAVRAVVSDCPEPVITVPTELIISNH
ncbi:MAG: LacI family DNA-binding transcriptional regulator [Spirochaetales bacterium]|nr:LacI family DNA-binding transcriptional regulator [Spirochaetales bacterium]